MRRLGTLDARRRSLQLPLALLVLFVSTGCAAFEDRLIVRRSGDGVTIEGEREGRLVTVRREPVPLSDCRVIAVTGGDDEVWRVTTISPDASLAELRYGETPGGYAQVTPPIGPAPDLRSGESYRVECLGPRWLSTSFRAP